MPNTTYLSLDIPSGTPLLPICHVLRQYGKLNLQQIQRGFEGFSRSRKEGERPPHRWTHQVSTEGLKDLLTEIKRLGVAIVSGPQDLREYEYCVVCDRYGIKIGNGVETPICPRCQGIIDTLESTPRDVTRKILRLKGYL